MEQSIYQMIFHHIKDGVLEPGFALPEEESAEPTGISFAPGALDGILFYHSGPADLDAAHAKLMARAVRSAAAGDYVAAEGMFARLTGEIRAISLVDSLQRYVAGHFEQLDPENVYQTVRLMVLRSGHEECVKIGLELLEMFQSPDEEIKTIIRRLGLYDEFTIFAVWNMCKWENADREIFALAQKVTGWGRIHAVENLQTEDSEIRRWLLTDGWRNEIMVAYSALACWEKSGAAAVLAGSPSEEEYQGIVGLIDGLLDEGPVPGLSEVEDARDVLLRFLEITPDLSRGIEGYEVALHILGRAKDVEDPCPDVSEACEAILYSEKCVAAVHEAVRNGEGFELAEALGIPFSPEGISLHPPLQIDWEEP